MKFTLVIIIALASIFGGWMLSASTHPKPKFQMAQSDSNSLTELDTSQKDFVRVFDMVVAPETSYQKIDFGFSYTSFIIEILNHQSVSNVKYTDNEGFVTVLNGSSNADLDGDRELTGFVIPNRIQNTFNFFSGSLHGKIRIYLFYAPPIQQASKKSLQKAEDSCTKPFMVLGTTWRSGLPAPTGTREPTLVRHNIVHHAASSNSNHDYMNVVRNIYLLHTQSNGWDDIGYNFLVAQDGTIFEGRDPQGTSDMDDTKGAHLCGKNSGTMGVCVLGNYMEVSPTTETMASLKQLILWKCVKSHIDPTAALPHPDANSAKLHCVAGHKDGCATACPGDSLYRLLPELRQTINKEWLACGGIASLQKSIVSKYPIQVISTNSNLKILAADYQWNLAIVYDLMGRKLGSYGIKQPIPSPPTGRYVIRLYQNQDEIGACQFEVVK